MNKYKFILFSLLLSTGLIGCSEDDANDNPKPQTASVSVELTDAPGDYEKVFVQVVDVMIKLETEEDAVEGWQSLGDINEGIYDLLTLTGGESELLAETELPPGHLTGMRLVLGSNNTIVVEGIPYPLKVPSGEESGLKLQVDHTLEAGKEYNFVLDFDVDKSVVHTGSDEYLLKPVIRLFLEEETGAISGEISPADVPTLVVASNATTTVSAYTNAEGEFMLKGLPAGTYTVVVTPDATLNFPILTYTDITVESGVITEMDPINLE